MIQNCYLILPNRSEQLPQSLRGDWRSCVVEVIDVCFAAAAAAAVCCVVVLLLLLLLLHAAAVVVVVVVVAASAICAVVQYFVWQLLPVP